MHRYLVDEIAFGTRTGKQIEILASSAVEAAELALGKRLEVAVRVRTAVARVQMLNVETGPAVSYFSAQKAAAAEKNASP